jgi:uncharacterized protein (DUF2267 family)
VPVPFQYDAAGPQFHQLLRDARDLAGLTTTNQSYTMLEAVLLLCVRDATRFADVLPAVARAIFVAQWDPAEQEQPYPDRAALTREVQQLRAEHNYAPDTAISDVAAAVRRNVDQSAFDRCLAALGPEAIDYWMPLIPDVGRDFSEFSGPVTMARGHVCPPRVPPVG